MARRQKSLWESDDEDLNNGDVKTSKCQSGKRASTLFDSDTEDPVVVPAAIAFLEISTEPKDYKKLYEEELSKREALDCVVKVLTSQVEELKRALSELTGAEAPTDSKQEDDDQKPADTTISNKLNSEWELLAKEEKLRRQHKIRAIQSKQRIAQANKRGYFKGEGSGMHASESLNSIEDLAKAGSIISKDDLEVHSATSPSLLEDCTDGLSRDSPAVGAYYLDSSDDNASSNCTNNRATTTTTGIFNNSYKEHKPDLFGSDEEEEEEANANETVVTTATTAATAAAAAVVDLEAEKWKELAAEERQRKALARRSVRSVRRPAASNATATTVAGVQLTAAGEEGVVKQRHLRGARLRSAIPPATTTTTAPVTSSRSSSPLPPVPPAAAAPAAAVNKSAIKSNKVAFSDSDWSDSENDSDSIPYSSSNMNKNEAKNGTLAQNDNNPTPAPAAVAMKVAVASEAITMEQEALLDARLRRWAMGKSIGSLLANSVVALQVSISAGIVRFEEVEAAVEPLAQLLQVAQNTIHADHAVHIRKAYM